MFGDKMRRFFSIGITGGVAIIAASLLCASRPVIHVSDDTPLWSTEYDASRQATIHPGPGTPLAQLKAGDRLRVLWIAQGKDYRAYLVIGPHWQKGWVLYRQRGLALSVILNGWEPNERSGVDAGQASLFAFRRPCPGATHRERSIQ